MSTSKYLSKQAHIPGVFFFKYPLCCVDLSISPVFSTSTPEKLRDTHLGAMPNTNQGPLTPRGTKLDPMELIPDPEPRRDGRRMSGSTIPDAFKPIMENGRQYQGYRPGGASIPHFCVSDFEC